jgi:hypothetical protein
VEDEAAIPAVGPLSQVEKRRARGRRRSGGIGLGVDLEPPLSVEPAMKAGGLLSPLAPWGACRLAEDRKEAGGGRRQVRAGLLLHPSLQHHNSDSHVKHPPRRPARVIRQNRPPPAGRSLFPNAFYMF